MNAKQAKRLKRMVSKAISGQPENPTFITKDGRTQKLTLNTLYKYLKKRLKKGRIK